METTKNLFKMNNGTLTQLSDRFIIGEISENHHYLIL